MLAVGDVREELTERTDFRRRLEGKERLGRLLECLGDEAVRNHPDGLGRRHARVGRDCGLLLLGHRWRRGGDEDQEGTTHSGRTSGKWGGVRKETGGPSSS